MLDVDNGAAYTTLQGIVAKITESDVLKTAGKVLELFRKFELAAPAQHPDFEEVSKNRRVLSATQEPHFIRVYAAGTMVPQPSDTDA